MKKTILLITIIIINKLLIINDSYASKSEDLYIITIGVEAKSINIEEKNNLVKKEFNKLITKLVSKEIDLEIENIDEYINKYEYQEHPTVLKIYFNKYLINKTLIEKGYNFLTDDRPKTIIWYKTTDLIHNHDLMQNLLKQISKTAKERGLLITYPIMDLTELEAINKRVDLNNLDYNIISKIKELSQKYEADEIIVANSKEVANTLQINWKSIVNNWELNNYIVKNDDCNHQANLFIDHLLENFLKLYATNNKTEKNKQSLLISIDNIINLEDYLKVEKYFQTLSIIDTIKMIEIESGTVTFQVLANADQMTTKKIIATSRLLKEQYNKNINDGISINKLFYILN